MGGIFVFLLLMNGLQYFFSVDITASVKNLLTPNPKIDLTVVQDEPDTVPEIKAKKQTFHIILSPEAIFQYSLGFIYYYLLLSGEAHS